MKLLKWVGLSVCIAVLLPLPIISDEINAQDIDVSESTIHLAGPESIYIRSVQVKGEEYALHCKADSKTGDAWVVSSVSESPSKIAPEGLIFDFASLSTKDENILEISSIIVENEVYQAKLKVDQNGNLTLLSIDKTGPSEKLKKKISILAEALGASDTWEYDKTIAQLKTEKESVEGKLNTTEENLKAAEEDLKSKEEDLKKAKGEIQELRDEYKKLLEAREEQREEKETEPQDERTEIPEEEGEWVALPTPLNKKNFGTLLHTGISGGTTQLGEWSTKGETLYQTDGDQYFAKHVYPVVQSKTPTLFSFTGKSTGEGWVGFGLHIFAKDNTKMGYGYGNSLLVWITRDEDFYGTGETRLQLYRSDSEIHMQHVLDGIITEPISEYLNIDILYLPEEEYISLFINGVEKLRYKTWFSIDSGAEAAFRTLGDGASFKDFSIRTK